MKTLKKISVTIFAVMMISSVTVANAQQNVKKIQLKKGMSHLAELVNNTSEYLTEIFTTTEDGNLMEYTGEYSPLVEEWMLNSGSWNTTETEMSEAALKGWMLNAETWNSNETESVEVKDWMLDTSTWAPQNTEELAEQDIEPADWMLCPELMAPGMDGSSECSNDVPVQDWMLQTASWAK